MTDQLGAKLVMSLLQSLAVVAIVSPLALWRYAAAVLQAMRSASGTELALAAPRQSAGPGPARAPAAGDAGAGGAAGAAAWQWHRRVERRVAVAWLLAVAAAVLPLVVVSAVAVDVERASMPQYVVSVATLYLAAAVPAVALSLGWTWRRGLAAWALLVLAGMLVTLLYSEAERALQGRPARWDLVLIATNYGVLAAITLSTPALLLAASGAARVRGVVAMVFGGVAVMGALPAVAVTLWETLADTRAGTALFQQAGAAAMMASRYVLQGLLMVPLALLVWWRLHRLAAAYAAKRFSDVQFLMGAWWFMFAVLVAAQALTTAPGRWWAAAALLPAAALFAPAQRLAFAAMRVARDAPPTRTLLLLRVFGFRARTEHLFDRIGSRWRYHGPVTMIAAPDVVARTVDAVDFLDWLLGRLGSRFVRDAGELQRQLAAMDLARDPDGRFRIADFGCADTTWRATVVELMHRADVVLMDLRGMTDRSAGCAFELGQLGLRMAPQRVVLVVEPGADRRGLAALLGMAADSVLWFELPDRRSAPTAALFQALLRAADTPAAGAA